MSSRTLYLIAILVSLTAILSMMLTGNTLNSNDAYFYAIISKNIAQSNDWINLTFNGADWLDKPHLPFWITAMSYKIFAINTFSYILPGVLFYLLGGVYLYKLSQELIKQRIVSITAVIIYLTTFRLMLSSIDVRAEVYLLGTIIPANYYWLKLYRYQYMRYVLLGAIFTAAAIITKGLFVVITITTGLLAISLYDKTYHRILNYKTLLSVLLVALFITPELITLYLQFDLHPDKIVFGHQNVSGIKFFFWDSQFGRFFNSGPITHVNHSLGHYFFFLHVIAWGFLPWTLPLLYCMIFSWRNVQPTIQIYLWGNILPTFCMFSITEFQLDHYTNIILPYFAIWLAYSINRLSFLRLKYLYTFQSYMLAILLIVIVGLCIYIQSYYCYIAICTIPLWLIKVEDIQSKLISNSAIIISVILITVLGTKYTVLSKYDAGYVISRITNAHKDWIILDRANLLSLEFYAHNPYLRVDGPPIYESSDTFYISPYSDNCKHYIYDHGDAPVYFINKKHGLKKVCISYSIK